MIVRRHTSTTSLPVIGGVLLVMLAILLGVREQRPFASHAATTTVPTLDQIPYPHVMLYGGNTSNGWPYIGSETPTGTCSGTGNACAYASDCNGGTCTGMDWQPFNGPLNMTAITAASRYPFIILPPTPMTDQRPDMMAAFRSAGPTNNLIGYTLLALTWCPQDQSGNNSYAAGVYYRDYWLAATENDVHCNTQSNDLLWFQNGTRTDDWLINVNIAKRVSDGNGGYTYPIADALAQTVFNHTVANGAFDGIFVDCACNSIIWGETTNLKIDYARAGYGSDNSNAANRTAFDAGWQAGHAEFFAKLRSLVTAAGKADFPILGNGCPSSPTVYPNVNGWMREGFPYQDGGGWYNNMYRSPGGYFFEDTALRVPQFNLIFGGLSPYWTPNTAANMRYDRFLVATAALGKGIGSAEEASIQATIFPNHTLWFDEYGVDLTTGHSAGGDKRGWLGFPKGSQYQVINQNPNPELVTPGTFESGANGWSVNSGIPGNGTLVLESANTPSGSQAAHVHVNQSLSYDYGVSLVAPGQFTINANQEYGVTFWAKADHERDVVVVFDRPAAGGYANQHLQLSTEWKQYQVRLVSTVTHNDSQFWFGLSLDTGDVWFDDIHVQSGMTSVYRRDFDHGIVLVNPTDSSQTVTLEKPYQKILGTLNPTINDGSEVTTVSLAGAGNNNGVGDALFLIDIDRTAPGRVTDLRPGS